MTKAITGVLPILHTPFTAEDRIDQVSFQQQIDIYRRGLFANDRRRAPNTWSLDDETRAEVDRLLDHLKQALSLIPLAERADL